MSSFQQNAKPDKALQLSLKWESAFRDLMDDIFWPGYSQQLFDENPKGYQREYYYFIALYDEPPPVEENVEL